MIDYVNGDLMSATERVIVHGCNNQGVMGSGVAKAVRDNFPTAYEQYVSLYGSSMKPTLGFTQPVYDFKSCKWIINAITQEYYGRTGKKFVSYDAIDIAFRRIGQWLEDNNQIIIPAAIAIPKIGAGLGGGSWPVIASIIDSAIPKVKVKVYCQ